jgi:hypothetical protein
MLYAIFTDRPGPDTPPTDPADYEFAGSMAFINSSVADQMSEPGHIMIMKPYQVIYPAPSAIYHAKGRG